MYGFVGIILEGFLVSIHKANIKRPIAITNITIERIMKWRSLIFMGES
jgi:hypothetical protein